MCQFFTFVNISAQVLNARFIACRTNATGARQTTIAQTVYPAIRFDIAWTAEAIRIVIIDNTIRKIITWMNEARIVIMAIESISMK